MEKGGVEITRDSLWRTATGELVAVKDMTDSHLLNLVRVFRNMSPIGTTLKALRADRMRWVNALANEAYARGLTLDELMEGEPVHE
jgi:hypothetical protein